MRGAIYNGSTITTSRKIGLFFSSSPSLISPQSLIYEKYVYKRIEIITNNLKQQRDMGNLIKGLKVAAYVAEIIVANSGKKRLPRVKSSPLMLRLKTDSTSDEWIMTRKQT
jgi:hypothetical protein